ncbi:MAG: M20 family metallopeptidase [Bacillota bacterium]
MEMIYNMIDKKEEAMIKALEELVNIDSGSYTKEGTDKIISLNKDIFTDMGFEVEVDKQEERGNNMIAQKKGKLEGNFLFLCHIDTVFEEGTAAKRPFTADRENDRAYGPGVCDMKSGVVVLRSALEALFSSGQSMPDITVILNGDEEIGSPSSRPLIEAAAEEATHCFVMEPGRSGDDVVVSRKGVGIFAMDIKGKPTHAGSNHAEGASAVEELARKVLDIHNLTDYDRGITLNVGVVEGGKRPNIVAEDARAEIDLRFVKKDQGPEIEAELNKIAAETYIDGTKTELSGGINRPPMEKNDKVENMYQAYKKAGKELGLDIGAVSTGGASDGNFVSAMEVPTLDALGAVGGNAHNDEEYIVLSSLKARAKVLAGGLVNLIEDLNG